MTFWQFVDKWIGKEADWDHYAAGQCVDLFRYYCDEVLNISQPAGVWGAANFWTNFESDPVLVANFTKIENTADFTPLEGDVMVWNFNTGGGFGHIAMCTGENTITQYFKSFDQNWTRVSYCEIVNHSYKNVYGVLRPISSTQEQMPSKLLDHIGVKTEEEAITVWNKEMAFLKDERSKTERLEITITSKEKTIADLKKSHQDYLDTIASILWGEGEPTIADKDAIREKIEELAKDKEGTLELENKLEREKNKHAGAIVGYEKRLKDLKIEMASMELKHTEQIARVTQRVDDEIEGLQKQKEQYEVVNRFISWISKIFNKE